MMDLQATQALTVLVVQVVSMVQEIVVDQELHKHQADTQVILAEAEAVEAVVLEHIQQQHHLDSLHAVILEETPAAPEVQVAD
jgi:hypothetical protein